MDSRRVLITGISTYWGARLAQALEQNEAIEAIIGVDSEDPSRELERTEFVRVGTQHALLRRIVDAAEIDTVVDTRLIVDSTVAAQREVHENNVIGTMNILAACSGPDTTVRKFVFKSSAHYYGTAQDDPAFFTESMGRPHPPKAPIERDIVESTAAVADFADKNPGVSVTILRFANVLGPDVRTSHTRLLSLPAVPMILGFDPRYQFVHEDDVVRALAHATQFDVPGIYNVGADGVLAMSEVAGLLGKPYAPVLPPWGTSLALGPLRRLGLNVPPEVLGQLRFGRGLDNRKLKATGFAYRYTTRETVQAFAEFLRLRPILAGMREPYRYEREVEDFLRWSPHVRNPNFRKETPLSAGELVELQKLLTTYGDPGNVSSSSNTRAAQAEQFARVARAAAEDDATATTTNGGGVDPSVPVEQYDDLDADEIVSLLDSLEDGDLAALRVYETSAAARPGVLSAIDAIVARRGGRPVP
ncbi:MAG: UDP-glucose 4-epimerase [Thermoleophilales bacterium]|jgi:UDP-glucose 4-epimerase|nr:UDP-glucose 4-epimerase [Thermoleophilales bacterium]